MASAKKMTPHRAALLGRRWTWASVAAAVAGAVLLLLDLDDWLVPVLLAIWLCLAREARHAGWRDGYLARRREEPQRPATRLQVLRLPMEEVDGGLREPFALVLDGVRAVSDKAAENVENSMTKFARECGGRAALVSTIPIDVVESPESGDPGTQVMVVADHAAGADELRQMVKDMQASSRTVGG